MLEATGTIPLPPIFPRQTLRVAWNTVHGRKPRPPPQRLSWGSWASLVSPVLPFCPQLPPPTPHHPLWLLTSSRPGIRIQSPNRARGPARAGRVWMEAEETTARGARAHAGAHTYTHTRPPPVTGNSLHLQVKRRKHLNGSNKPRF